MRTKILVVLLFAAVCTRVLGVSDKAEDGKRGMCLGEFLEKHADLKEKLEVRFQKRSKKWKDHSHHLSNLQNCMLDEDCTNNTICCKTLRGSMKCLDPIFSEKDIKWLHKDDNEKSRKRREGEEFSDKAEGGERGMCLGEFLKRNQELKEKMKEHFHKKSKIWKNDKGKEGHFKHHFHYFSNLPNCKTDDDCTENTICCKTRHGSMKCMKPIFSKKVLKWLNDDDEDDDEEKSRDEHEDKAEDGKRGMCLREFLEKHPDLKEKMEELFQKKSEKWKDDKDREGHSKHRFLYSKLPNCTLDADCTNNTICCKSHFGAMKCIKPIFSEKDIKWLHKNDKKKSWNEIESEETSDKAQGEKLGMCLTEFLEKHPELKEKVEGHFQKKSKKWKDDKGGEEYSKQHHSHLSTNCMLYEECTDNTICCKTWSGAMKCKKPIFSKNDIKWLHDDDKDKNRDKREAEEPREEAEHDKVVVKVVERNETQGTVEAHVKGHREREEHKPGEGRGKGFQYKKVHHKGPIKGESQVDETFSRQGLNRKTKGV